MEFRIADTFTDSLGRLTGEEQKAVKTTAFDLQVNPASPGMQFHRIDRTRDKDFWSVRVSRDLRVIVHRTESSLLLCYVAHHDPAYDWAQRRVVERHPTTGAAQLVEVRETVREIEVPSYATAAVPESTAAPLFQNIAPEELLEYGVPEQWLWDVQLATEDTLLDLVEHLPGEAAEALLQLATGGVPPKPARTGAGKDPFEHPDAQRRFHLVTDSEELARALEFPWEKWTVFLHPSQRDLVERTYNGPARVAGSAGTGKTVVALHRAAHLLRTHPDARVLLTTFNPTLARALRHKVTRLIGQSEPLTSRLTVAPLDDVAAQLSGPVQIASADDVRDVLRTASHLAPSHRFSERFLEAEWSEVVDAWQLTAWDQYRDVARLGRKTRLGEQQRALLWAMFEQVRRVLDDRGLLTGAGLLGRAADLARKNAKPAFDFVVVDEAQDISVPQLRFLAALGHERPDALFFAGDLGQRIFQTPFSWRSLGVDVRGRSHTLRINYRTSHQIRRRADRLLGPEMSDVDGNVEVRTGAVSAFSGPEPEVHVADSELTEREMVAQWLDDRVLEGLRPEEIAVFVRTDSEIERAKDAVRAAGLEGQDVDASADLRAGAVAVGVMHLAKGLEFRAVSVMACDDEVLPSQRRIEAVADEADLEDIYDTERQLLYVACTRARDHLLVTGVEPASEFIDDLRSNAGVPR